MANKYLIIAILLLCIVACRSKPGEVIVAFYNCENLFDTVHDAGKQDGEFTPAGRYHYTTAIYNEKLHNIARVLAAMVTDDVPNGPAMIGLAEVENNHVLDALVAQISIAGRHYKYIWYNSSDRRGINVALLYDPQAFTVVDSEPLHVALPDTGVEGATRDILHVVGILYDDTVHILVNHWPSRIGGTEETEYKRVAAAEVCRNEINKLSAQKSRVIVMGDFNENPTDTCIKYILGATADTRLTDSTPLYDPWVKMFASGKGTLVYKHEWFLFDQIMISKRLLDNDADYRYDKIEVFKPSFIASGQTKNEIVPHRSFAGTCWIHGYSDHFPVLMYLKKR